MIADASTGPDLHLGKYRDCLEAVCPIRSTGTVTDIVGLVVESKGPVAKLGTVCDIYTRENEQKTIIKR